MPILPQALFRRLQVSQHPGVDDQFAGKREKRTTLPGHLPAGRRKSRAAVVYLRHFELTRDEGAREKAEALLRFIAHMQRDDGLFYNFVWNNQLDINKTHPNSRANRFGWWAARGRLGWRSTRC